MELLRLFTQECADTAPRMPLCAAVSIVERDRQYSKSTGGTQERWSTPRHMSFCAYTFLPKLPSVLVVEDTLKDARCALFCTAAPHPKSRMHASRVSHASHAVVHAQLLLACQASSAGCLNRGRIAAMQSKQR